MRIALNKLILLFFFFPISSYGLNCNDIKTLVIANKSIDKESVDAIRLGVDKDDLCYKNLMGIMYYRGIKLEKNIELAEQIFYDVGNQNYPEAQYNFALAVSMKAEKNHKEFMSLVTGLFKKYINNRKYADIGSSARDLGFKYLEDLKNSNINADELQSLENTYFEMIKNEHKSIAEDALKNSQDIRENSQTILGLIAIGMVTYTVANSYYPNSYSNRSPFIQESNPWWDGNPMKQNLYQWPRP